MESPRFERPPILSPSSSGRRSRDSNSPEFEFWMVRNPSLPQPDLLSADELFADGVLVPLHLLQHQSADPPDPSPDPAASDPHEPDGEPGQGPELVSETVRMSGPTLTASKRWKDIFKKNDRRSGNDGVKEEKKKERKAAAAAGGGPGNGASPAELNINIWPFRRSRSAGNGGSRPKMVAGSAASRKTSSAPCSRSNSAGESKSRKWPSSPSRGGVHLGRSSPVWQVRRGVRTTTAVEPVVRYAEKAVKNEVNEARQGKPSNTAGTNGSGGGGSKAKVLSLNVPMCVGYRNHLTCRGHENGANDVVAAVGAKGGGDDGGQSVVSGSNEGGRGGNLFSLRNLFTRRVY